MSVTGSSRSVAWKKESVCDESVPAALGGRCRGEETDQLPAISDLNSLTRLHHREILRGMLPQFTNANSGHTANVAQCVLHSTLARRGLAAEKRRISPSVLQCSRCTRSSTIPTSLKYSTFSTSPDVAGCKRPPVFGRLEFTAPRGVRSVEEGKPDRCCAGWSAVDVTGAFLRIDTHPRVFREPLTSAQAWNCVDA